MSKPKRNKAVALVYDREINKAPTVTAKGEGLIAKKIKAIAKENGVYIHEDEDLIEVLSKLDLGSQIPDELYAAVAKILAKVYTINQKLKNKLA